MCRGGKDGVIRRCKASQEQHASSVLRKRVKYRANKEGITTEEWKENNPDAVNAFREELFPLKQDVSFQSITETRRLPEGIPARIDEHVEINKEELSHLTANEKRALKGYSGYIAGIVNDVLREGDDSVYEYHENLAAWSDRSENFSGFSHFNSPEDMKNYIEVMDNLVGKRQEVARVVYRGTPIYASLHDEIGASIGKELDVDDTEGLAEGLREYYKPGKIISNDTYLSTSQSAYYVADRSTSREETKITYWDKPEIKGLVFELKTNAGLDIISTTGHNDYEREVLLPRGTSFKIINIEVKPESYDTVSGYEYDDYDNLHAQNFKGLAAVIQMVEVDKDGNEISHTEPHKPEKPLSDLF